MLLEYIIYWIYALVLFAIWYQDYWEHKIKLYVFYLFALLGILFFYVFFYSIWLAGVMWVLFLIIFVMDMIEIVYWEIKYIWKDWRIFGMGVYDLYFYIYLAVLIFGYIFMNFGELMPFVVVFASFLITFLVWFFLLWIGNKKSVPFFSIWSVFMLVFMMIYITLDIFPFF